MNKEPPYMIIKLSYCTVVSYIAFLMFFAWNVGRTTSMITMLAHNKSTIIIIMALCHCINIMILHTIIMATCMYM